ncbi:hypothetical protein [Bacillus sp. 37MA]|uniref:hypothetical protein n=1 Tax=Bacillus sp. 37MA TaxID=1132442 RepID=UPI0018C946E0|nr:hypothetical protein [Bacillus sp. 37MA]
MAKDLLHHGHILCLLIKVIAKGLAHRMGANRAFNPSRPCSPFNDPLHRFTTDWTFYLSRRKKKAGIGHLVCIFLDFLF